MFFKRKKLISINSFDQAYLAAVEKFQKDYWDRDQEKDKSILLKGFKVAITLWLRCESYENIKKDTYDALVTEFLYVELR